MAFRHDDASKADRQRPRRSWLAPALGLSLAAHAGLAAMLWVERPAQSKAGAVVGVEIVSIAGAANSSSMHGGMSAARGTAPLAKPAPAPAPAAPVPPESPRAVRDAPQHAVPPREAPPLAAPEHVAAAPAERTALRKPAPSEAANTPAAANAPRPAPPETATPPVDELDLRPPARAARDTATSAATPAPAPPRARAAPRAKEIALRKPARVPPPPAAAPRLAGPAAPRGSERAAARPQHAGVPIVAADAAPAAGPENGTTPPRHGFGSAANPIPRYPRLARENGWEGVVMLTVQVSAGGETLSVGIVKSSGHGLLDASAVDAVRRWRFDPARRAGIPVPGTATVPIRFRLEE